MERVKMYVIWALLIVVGFILVRFLSQGIMIKAFENINNYEILVQAPSITVTEAKATNVNGYISGTVKNNTDALIYEGYMLVDFYNSQNSFVGRKVVEVKDFQVGKTAEYRVSFKYNDVKSFTIQFTDEAKQAVTLPKRATIDKDLWERLAIATAVFTLIWVVYVI